MCRLKEFAMCREIESSSLGDDAVGPLHQADKNCGIAEFCAPLSYICFRDPTGPAAGPSSKDGNVFGHIFSNVSLSGGQPTGTTAFAVALRIKEVASPRRKI